MKIMRIFGPGNDPEAGLWSLKNDGEKESEFDKILSIWRDVEIMYNFCTCHLDDLKNAFGYDIKVPTAADQLMDEADELEEQLYNLAIRRPFGTQLQQLFKPLDNWRSNLTALQLSKGSAMYRRKPKCRIYAVRIDPHTYVVTGGAIKLTHRMEDRMHTRRQLSNLVKASDWLKQEGILTAEDLKNLL